MKQRPEGWNIVLAGFWNRSIFLPVWAFPRLFPQFAEPGHEVQTEVALLSALPLIYRDSQVAMEISGARLAFQPQVLNDECLLRCEAMARSMLLALPETPVQAVGINFGFREDLAAGQMGALFTGFDDTELGQQGWEISERKLVRRLVHGDDTLILTLTQGREGIDFDFNFNTEAVANRPANRAVEERRSLRLRDAALALLSETYHLELEGDNDENGS